MDLTTVLENESHRFRAALGETLPTADVPTCPTWTAFDLAWHLTKVQWSFGSIVTGRHVDHPGGAVYEGLPREAPAYTDLLALHERATARLLAAFASTPDDTPLWSFVDRDTDVGWALRRQAHEALVHRIDAELTADVDALTPVAPDVAADGIHELLTELLTRADRGRFAPSGLTVDLQTTDTGDRWSVSLGRLHRPDPRTGEPQERAGAELRAPVGTPDARILGPASALHAWAYGRAGSDELTVQGDTSLLAATRDGLRSGT